MTDAVTKIKSSDHDIFRKKSRHCSYVNLFFCEVSFKLTFESCIISFSLQTIQLQQIYKKGEFI